MEGLKLNVNNKVFLLVFSMSTFRILGKKWELPGLQEVLAKILEINTGGEQQNLSFKTMDILEDLLVAAIQAGGNPDFDINKDKVIDSFLKNPDSMTDLVTALTTEISSGKKGKPTAVPKKATAKQRVKK